MTAQIIFWTWNISNILGLFYGLNYGNDRFFWFFNGTLFTTLCLLILSFLFGKDK